ncbi:erythromycin esterase [Lishizhenia tianjinensis]|uniref:Erythromycin esterase n=1 Tax=Lishizhenia tianjinensis TaxID=477690 RepID=A0A1I7A209_9FLAO|nr:erythromycin esterase family protein [Lishizhenia tianjinensis]SFT68969.1 erythromycin esterase [Lishizhenia tianjinensis]
MYRIIFILFFYTIAYGQSSIHYLPLTDKDPKLSSSDFQAWDSIFKNKQIIGLGESTHGTHEFTPMRHKLFKYLVEHHGFNTIFIEADYSATQRLNRYINGAEDTLLMALMELQYWAWKTEGMKDFIVWLRDYNKTAPHKIQLVGCDMQSLVDDKIELQRNSTNGLYNTPLPKFLSTLEKPYEDSLEIAQALEEWNAFCSKQRDSNMNLLQNNISYFLQHKLHKTDVHFYRDSCMAEMQLHYLKRHPLSKAIYIAHNYHVSRSYYHYANYTAKKSCGKFLHQHLGDQYLSIAMTFNTGSFNAFHSINDKLLFQSQTLKNAHHKSVEHRLSKLGKKLLLVDYSSLKKVDKLKITQLGAILYNTGKEKNWRYRYLEPKQYDYIIYFEETSASRILYLTK